MALTDCFGDFGGEVIITMRLVVQEHVFIWSFQLDDVSEASKQPRNKQVNLVLYADVPDVVIYDELITEHPRMPFAPFLIVPLLILALSSS